MKKILILCVAALSMMSCLSKGSFSQSYMADVTFEFSDNAYQNSFKDSLFVLTEGEGFVYMQYPIVFSQKHLDGKFQGGFIMSYLQGEADGQLQKTIQPNDAYRVHAKSGAQGSKTYVVFYDNPVQSIMPQHDIEFAYRNSGDMTPKACYVNNTTLVARKIKDNFKKGDKMVLKAIGHRGDGTRTEASIVLAEYSADKDSVMYNWTTFDLSPLGTVDYVDFEVTSTNPDVPAYFCMDRFYSNVLVEY